MTDGPPQDPSAPDPNEEPAPEFLPDPYLFVPVPPPPPRPQAGLSPAALASVLAALVLGPVGAILAILLGWYARREIDQPGSRRTGYALATTGIALGVIPTPAGGFAMSYVAWTRAYRADPASAPVAAPPPPPPSRPPPPRRRAAAPPVLPTPQLAAPPRTRVDRVGRITVVDVGRSTAQLSDELARQRAEAATASQTMVVMVTMGRCDPCRGVDRAIEDRLMQTALAQVRLVRVDGEVFSDDLEALHIPGARVPGFFLLALDLSPRDGIDGGEWDADVAANIAPVLGAFVRGKYTERRERWRPVPGSGMSL